MRGLRRNARCLGCVSNSRRLVTRSAALRLRGANATEDSVFRDPVRETFSWLARG